MDNKQEIFSDIIRREANMAKTTANIVLRTWIQTRIREAVSSNKNYIGLSGNPKLSGWEYSSDQLNELIDWLKAEGFNVEYKSHLYGWKISW